MNIFDTLKNTIVRRKRVVSFTMAVLMAGMAVFPSVPGSIVSFAALNDGQQQGVTPGTNPDGTVPNGNKPQDIYDTARVYVNNTPLRLEVSKLKTKVGQHEGIAPMDNPAQEENTITYQLSGRVEGSESQLIQKYGSDNIELAYAGNGTYLGYGWKRGTLEYLRYREENRDSFGDSYVELVYNEYGVFSGYAYVTKSLETADDINRYVAGATMTLYDAIEIFRLPDYTKDDRFAGVTVTRNTNGDVTGVYVNKGYAGTKIEYVREETDESKITEDNNQVKRDDNYSYQDEINEKGEATWIAKTVQREDTPILYYSLSDLRITSNDIYYSNTSQNNQEIDKIFGNERPDKNHNLYGFDKKGNVINITQKYQLDFSIFAFENGNTKPVFEIVGGDLTKVRYNGISKTIEVGEDTIIYHLDEDGNRNAMTDPQTGIAYIEEEIKPFGNSSSDIHSGNNGKKIYVWPVNIYKDGTGSETFEKIKTNRVATINADTENEYIIGTYTGDNFVKSVNPTLDEHGMPIYYQKSDQTYVKGSDRYDRDGDYLGYGYTDKLDNDNLNAYTIKDHDNLYNGDEDNPFDQSTHYQYSTAQKIVVTVDVDGNYIVNGSNIVPSPVREGFVFGGWLVQPNNLKDGMTVNARWLNTGSMSIDQRNKWYSEKEATGLTKTITVEFNANGGMFTDGSGDIHSSDNKLYYRQGEAFLIENTWITGENTPNDPFDRQLVNIITQTSNTANDPYSGTNNGGMADMIKRVAAGNYIMEEVEAPAGYVKGLPVGITVNEFDQVQNAEMIDTTIKVQFIKMDSTDSYIYDIYENGNLKKNPDGTTITYKEPTGGFSYENVPGAVIALKAEAKSQKTFNEWIAATNHPEIEKVNDNGNWYITFHSDKPLYIEGLPKGNYILCELKTPNGYVTADDQKITVDETSQLVTYIMNDDHTKVEIKKYYNDGNGNVILPNQHSAGIELRDENGTIVSSWYTDDVSDYTSTVTVDGGFFDRLLGNTKESGFVKNYQDLINGGDLNFNSIKWKVERTATKKTGTDTREVWLVSDGSRVVIENGEIPENAPVGFREAYDTRNLDSEINQFKYIIEMSATKTSGETLSNQIWTTNTGKQIHICAYKSNSMTTSGKQGYLFEYKFNYKNDYTGIYANTVSYDTMDGIHRFDYLPIGTYVIHEFDVPDGFVRADDKTIVVNETKDIQLFDLENVRKELVIAKVAMDDKGGMFAGTIDGNVITGNIGVVIPGAELKLYKVNEFSEDNKKAFEDGEIPEGAVLVDEWTSGTDGEYTAKDAQKELIPAGYKVGDKKPHIVTDIENGSYYLVEAKTPDFYRTIEPMEISVTDTTTASNLSKILAVNKEMTGKIIIHKVNSQGSGLTGATFLVKNKTTGSDVGTLTTQNGYGELVISDIGIFDEYGNIKPYTFTVQETNAPAGYAVNDEIHEFSFNPNDHSGSAIAININDSAFNQGVLTVVDDVTAITIGKTDYEDGSSVGGAELQVFEAEFDGTEWKATDITKSSWKWTTTVQTSSHPLDGLIAGKSYVLRELRAPSGYTVADDMFFKVSEDGKRIEKIWYDKKENPFIQFNSDNTGAIESIQMSTRKAVGSYVALIDTETGTKKTMGTAINGLTLTDMDVEDGKVYMVKEIVRYSDGTEETINTTTFQADLEDGDMTIETTYAIDVITSITDHNGKQIVSFNPDGTIRMFQNKLIEENQGISVTGNGKDHSTINTSSSNTSVVTYYVKVEKAGSSVVLTPDRQTTVLRTEPNVSPEDGLYKWTTKKDNQTIVFSAILNDNAVGYSNQKVEIDGKIYSYMNPIAFSHGEGLFANTSKLSVFNEVAGTNPNNETYEFTYRISLTNEDGTPLPGRYDYRTKNGKTLAFEAYGTAKTLEVVLSGNDFVVVSDLPDGTNYSVRIIDPSGDGFTVKNGIADAKTSKNQVASVLFTNTRNLSSDRELFEKNSSYTITEKTVLNNDTVYESAKRGFSIGENCEVVSFDIKNKHTTVSIIKNNENGTPLIGARLAVYDLEGNQIEQWTTTSEPHVFVAKLEPGQTYVLKEVKSAPGYTFAKDIRFTVSDNGTVDKVIMVDKKTKVKILKVDENGNGLNGATIQILNKDKEPVKARVTDDTFEKGKDMIFESKAIGVEITNQLDANTTYYLREIVPPDGYHLAADDMIFITNKDETVKLVSITDVKTKVSISKADITTGKEIKGATLSIRDKSGNLIESWTSEETPHIIEGKLIAGETYVLHEESAPDGYYYTVDVEFTMPLHDEGIVKVVMEDEKTYVELKKTDITTSKEVPGAKVQIKDKDGNIIEEWVSTEEEHIIQGKLNAGETYIYHEEGAPDGYYYADDVEFTIPANKEDIQKVELQDAPIIVKIKKTDITNGVEVIGASLQIKDKNGKVIEEWVSDGSEHIIQAKLKAGETYILHEEGAPNGYYYTEDIEFKIPLKDEGIIKVEMKDAPTDVKIHKTDVTTGEEVPGAHLQLKDSHGDLIDEWISTTKPHEFKAELIAGQTYYLYETGAPDGYYYEEVVEFKIPLKDEGIVEVKMEDKPTIYEFTKTDITDKKEIPGAKLQIKDKEGNIIEEWISGTEPHKIVGKLIAGETYILHEEGTPNGYYYAEDIEFKIPLKDEEIKKVEMQDAPTIVHIKKTDITTGKEIPGAKLQIKDKNGNVIEEWISTEEAHVITAKLVAGEKYILHEEGAPDGYVYAEDIEFRIPLKDEGIIKVEMQDAPTHVEFKKTDATTTKELPGAHIQILDASGKVVEEWISTSENHIVSGKLVVDEVYIMHEEGAPDGYGYASDIKFKIDRDNIVWIWNEAANKWEKADESTVEMVDDVLKLEVRKVEEGTSNMIEGAKLQIIDSSGKVVEEWTTEIEKPHQIVKQFADGTPLKTGEVYTLVETEAPEGYLKTTTQTFTVNRDASIRVVVMSDATIPDNPGKEWTTPVIEYNTVVFDKYNGSYVENSTTTIRNSRKLEGAEYTIYRNDGTIYTTVTTGSDGSVTIKRPPVGTYFLKETKAPEGFLRDRNTYSFTIQGGGTVSGTLGIVNYKKPEVVISKKDAETKELVPGATLKILDSEGNVVFTGTTESNGQLVFTPEYADTFTIIETKAPEGYKINTTYVKFTVANNGTVSGTTTIFNEKLDKKIGSISANYQSEYNKNGRNGGNVPNNNIRIDRHGNVILPKSGDTFNYMLIGFAWLASLSFIGFFIYKKKNKRTKKG